MTKIKPEEGNNYFCIVPWTHTYVSAQGERRLCCLSIEKPTRYARAIDRDLDFENRPALLKDYWNSPYMMNIRKLLMSGEKISQCEICNNQTLLNTTLKSYYTETLFRNKINTAFEKTDDNGYTEMMPVSYHYLINNLCNFKCRMCGDQVSSSWENENKKRGKYVNDKPPWLDHKNEIISFQKEVVEAELLETVHSQTVEEINWSGGEPLLWPIHWEVMHELVKNGHSKNVVVRYNTNLSKIRYKNYDLYKILENFKDVYLACSIDGTELIGEYIRDGLIWQKWLDNFKNGLYLNKIFNEWTVYIDLTITTPGLFSVKDMIDLAIELDVNSVIKGIFNLDSQIIFNPLMLPRNILDEIIDDIVVYAKEKTKINKKIEKYISVFENLKNKKTFEEIDGDWLLKVKNAKQEIKSLDEYRNHIGVLDKIFSKNKKLISWWREI